MEGQVAYLQDELFTSLKRDSFHGNVNEILGVGILKCVLLWSGAVPRDLVHCFFKPVN